MRLKELRLHGFKSFPKKTVLELASGMTALVGPNGCGKSNILDAIRWVLGEQVLSRLRCTRGEDLIFAGSGRLPEQGYAEVSLVIENHGEFPDLPAEVELRRRYYRTGESSFWINREECRLKEIEAVLRGGAAGGRLYSVFDAAKLAAIVGGELHHLLESAADVLGFRERRRESERKLDAVRRDLLRLEDIIGERKRIVRSLARQRRRAELHTELRGQQVALEACKLGAKLKAVNAQIQAKTQAAAAKQTQERKLLLAIEELRKTIRTRDEELSRTLKAEHEARSALDAVMSRLAEIGAGLSASRTRCEALEENRLRLKEERRDAAERLTHIATEIKQAELAVKEAQSRRAEAEAKLKEARSRLRSDEEHLAALRAELRAAREDQRTLSARLAELIEERTRQRSRGDNAASLALSAAQELKELSKRTGAVREALAKLRGERKASSAALKEWERKIKDNEQTLADLEAAITEAERERRETLELVSRLAGETASLRDKIEDKSRKALRKSLGARFQGLMEEFFSCPAELEPALEAVFYDILGFAAANEMPDPSALALEGQAGLVLERGLAASAPKRPADARFKFWLADRVTLKKTAPALLAVRLANWVVVSAKDIAALAEKYPDLSFVTTDGTALRSDGVAVLGSPRGVLADRRRLAELEAKLKKAKRRLAALEGDLEKSGRRRDKIKRELEEARTAYLEERTRGQALKAEDVRLEEQTQELERERGRLRRESEARKTEAETAAKSIAEIAEKISELEAERSSKEENLNTLERTLAEAEETLRAKLSGLNEYLLAVGHEEETERVGEERRRRLETERERLTALLAAKDAEAERIEAELAELEETQKRLEAERTELEERRREHSERLTQTDAEAAVKAKRRIEAELAERTAELEELRSGLVQLRTELALLEKERTELEPLSPPDTDEDAEPMTLEEVEAKLAETARRLAELGPVNEYAAVQYEEEKTELDRLKAQHADITKAAESLSILIKEIDEEARERFDTAFRAVREEFRRTFNFFFPGGEANLRFENPEDPFNSPIHITARPEGKQLKRLAQLSDGERTMLGISLLFAFYAVRPAPFLFVDELDAPLDDSNVLKFASYLAHIKDRIQVFVITHNKRTMEKADTIYGITMEEPGVSRVISVRLKDVKRRHVAVEET